MKTLSWSAAVALLALVVCVPNAHADPLKCKKAIAKSSAAFAQARVKALAKCNLDIVKSGVAGTCPDTKASATIDKAEAKMRSTINKTCGGADKVCGGDTTGEDSAASVGWGECPSFEDGACGNGIVNCGDIADCLACVNKAAVNQSISLSYDDLELPSTTNKPLNSCQLSIGKATAAFLGAKSKALQKCWDARLAGKHGDNCIPPAVGDGKYIAAIDKARAKMETTICKACGGADKACGGGDDQLPADIGFQATCPPATIPGGAACGGAVTDLTGLKNCLSCITDFHGDCMDRNQVPEFVVMPSECVQCVSGVPSGPCPTTISFTANGTDADLDTGFTGLAHEAKVPTKGRLTLAVSGCAGSNQPTCGQCNVSGPLPNGGGPAFQNRRCSDQSWVPCTTDMDCTTAGAAGPCIYFFGAPLPLRAGNVSTCIVNRITGPVSGTINVEAGSSTTNVTLSSEVGTSPFEFKPCPTCEGSKCKNGPRNNFPCTVNGSSIFGDTSIDCPPDPLSVVAILGINLNIATGTQTRTVTAASPLCRATGFDTQSCLCDTCNDLGTTACQENSECPAVGGNPGICGGLRCLSSFPGIANQPCLQCQGGTNHGADCLDSSECPGGTCPTSCGVCLGGGNNGNPCNANSQCGSSCSGGANVGATCTVPSQCPGASCAANACQGSCNRPGQATKPDECTTPSLPLDPAQRCVPTADNHGECIAGPTEGFCSVQRFRQCSSDSDCAAPACSGCLPGQFCQQITRPCFPGNGIIGSEVNVTGVEDAPCNGVSKPSVGSFFCVAPVGATAVNAASGLPALGRVLLPGVAVANP